LVLSGADSTDSDPSRGARQFDPPENLASDLSSLARLGSVKEAECTWMSIPQPT
jgi:hypothetical protein